MARFTMAEVVLRNVRKSFDGLEVIHGADLTITHGEFVVFVGPSGCGKTTLLRLIAGLETITSGDILIDGARCNDVPPSDRGIAMVFQSYALYPHMSVFENMAFALRLAHMGKSEIHERVKRAADILQIQPLLERKPKALSGGQRQRVAIGRAIVREPKVFLFDEPLSNLDAALRVQTRIEIAKLHKDLKTTIVYVTHDQVEAMTMANVIVVMNSGTIEQVGAPLELYHRPRNLFVAGFLGSPKMNFMRGKLAAADGKLAEVVLQGGAKVHVAVDASRAAKESDVTLGIRPEHIVQLSHAPGRSGEDLGRVRGQVAVVENLGEGSLVYVKLPGVDGLTVCRAEGTSPAKEGDLVELGLPPASTHLFDADGKAFPRAGEWAPVPPS
jgi:multiple sugar transport system ATP-binding protein